MAGWAREASSGLVGTARKDGVNGAKAMLKYLKTLSLAEDQRDIIELLSQKLETLGTPVVKKENWRRLEEVERAKAQELNLEGFKFS